MTQEQLTFAFPKRLCFYSGRPMLQLKLHFPHFSRCIQGITNQCRLPMRIECPVQVDPVLRPSDSKTKEGWHQPTLFGNF